MRLFILILCSCAQKQPDLPPRPQAEAKPENVNTFYKYKGEHGVWSYTDSLEMVPEKYRKSAMPMNLPAAKPGEYVPPTPETTAVSPRPAPADTSTPAPVKPTVTPSKPAATPSKPLAEPAKDEDGAAKQLLEKAKALEEQAKQRAAELNE